MTPTTWAEACRQLKAAGDQVQTTKHGRLWYIRWRDAAGKRYLRRIWVRNPEDLLREGLRLVGKV